MPGMMYYPGGVRCFQNKCKVNHETGAKLFDIYIPGLSSNPHRAGNRNRIGQRAVSRAQKQLFLYERPANGSSSKKKGRKQG